MKLSLSISTGAKLTPAQFINQIQKRICTPEMDVNHDKVCNSLDHAIYSVFSIKSLLPLFWKSILRLKAII